MSGILQALMGSYPVAGGAEPTDDLFDFRFQNNLTNSGSNGATATVTGTTAYRADQNANANSAFDFQSFGTYIDLSSYGVPTADDTPLSIEWQFVVDALPGAGQSNTSYLFNQNFGANNTGVDVSFNNSGALKAQILNGSDGNRAEATWSGTIATGTWYQLIITFTGTTTSGGLDLYMSTLASDGTGSPGASGTMLTNVNIYPPSFGTRIGAANSSGSTRALDGGLARIRGVNRVWSAAELAAIYQAFKNA